MMTKTVGILWDFHENLSRKRFHRSEKNGMFLNAAFSPSKTFTIEINKRRLFCIVSFLLFS